MQQSMNIPSFRYVNRFIINQSKYFERFGPVRSYRLALKLFNDNEELADAFMLSEYGGYTDTELRRAKYDINRTSIKQG